MMDPYTRTERTGQASCPERKKIPSYELPWPGGGGWREIFNSDAYDEYPASGNGGGMAAYEAPRDGQPATARILIPSNSVLVFAR